jgi:hypothetical protein
MAEIKISKLIRSKRRTLGLKLLEGQLIVRAPNRVSVPDIEKFIREK